MLKIASADGGLLARIAAPQDVRAAAADERRGAVWLYAGGSLYRFGFDAAFHFSVPVGSPPDEEDADGRVAVVVNPISGNVWLGVGIRLYHVGPEGQLLGVFSLPHPVVDLSFDKTDLLLWVATVQTVGAVDESGREVARLALGRNERPQDVDVDQISGEVWVALKDVLLRYSAAGGLLAQARIRQLERVAADYAGGAWVSADKRISRLAGDMTVFFEVDPFQRGSATVDLVSHPLNSSAWIANRRQLAHIGPGGQILQVLDFDRNQGGGENTIPLDGRIFDLDLYADTIAPSLAFTAPAADTILNTAFPDVRLSYSDVGLGADTPTLAMQANGIDIAVACSFDEGAAECAPASPLPEGPVELTATIADYNGNTSDPARVSFFVDTVPPMIAFTDPADGEVLDNATPTFNIAYSDSGSGLDLSSYRTQINGTDVTDSTSVGPDGAVYTTGAPLPTGENSASATIADRAGNTATDTITFTITTGFRAIADCAPTSGTAPLSVRFRSRGEFPGGSIVRYRWDFEGDGTFDTSDAVARDYTRTFSAAGTFDAVLEVTNNFGDKATDTCMIEVGGNAPTATANASPSNGAVPLLVDFTCTGSDPDGTIVLYEWDFEGDGTFDFSSPASGGTSHTYTDAGSFVAVCRVTDNDGMTGTARTTTTVIQAGPPGSPSVTASASPASGNAPLNVSFNGTASDDGGIVLWEWDFDGDGTFDFSSPTSPATSHTYVNGGIFAALLRVTDDSGLTSSDTVEVIVNLNASLSIPDDTFDPTAGETASVNTSISAGVRVRIFIRDQGGATVRTLVEEFRAAGNYSDPWDGRNDASDLLPQAPYFAVLEYDFFDEVRTVDLTNSTGGFRYNPSRNGLPRVFRPFEDDLLTINFTIPAFRGASEIQAFVGLFRVDTRFITLLDRVPLGVGTHTIHWDGLDADGNPAVPPPGDSFLFGIFGFTLPDNAIFVQSAPVLSNLSVDPNIFDPGTPDFMSPDASTATVNYTLDRVADVELTVTNLETGLVLRTIRQINVASGAHTIEWDGRANSGLFVDSGNYRLSIQGIDSAGSQSLKRYALVRVFY